MTPQERKLVEDLFERLATLERNPREPEAEQLIRNGLRLAPNATYALVQTVLLQDEALRQAIDRIQELETGEAPQQGGGGFLDSMRDAVFGGGRPRSAVPPVGGDRPMGVPQGFPRSGDPYQTQGGPPYPQQPEPARGGSGGSFLGTAAATAAGVIGGAMLMNSLKGAFGGDQAKAHGLSDQALGDVGGQQNANPWGGDAASGGDLSRQAGLDSIGKPGGESERAGLYDQSHAPMDDGATLPEDDGGFDLDLDTDFL